MHWQTMSLHQSHTTFPGSFRFIVTAHPLEPNTNDLLGALLNATYQQNEMLAQLLQLMRDQADKPSPHQASIANWKKANPELSKNVGVATTHLNELFQQWLTQLCEDALELEADDQFNLREFIDKYGAAYSQFGSMISSLQSLAT